MRTEFFRIILGLTACACASAGHAAPTDDLKLKSPDHRRNLMLVLVSGRVIQGDLTPRPGGYDVNLPAGRMFVPAQQIRFTADSLDDAYLGMRNSIAEFTPDAHLALARWCLTNRLTSRARLEILDALKLDPYRDDAKRMLENLVREQRKVNAVAQPARPDDGIFERRYADRRSLGGLPEDLARQFTQRIQPLVTARCGNARCHSAGTPASAERTFLLTPTLRRPTPAITEQNLAAVLRHLDLNRPTASPLLQVTHGLHGGSRQLLFSNRTGGRQREILTEWVHAVAAALGNGRTSVASTASTRSAEVDSAPQNMNDAADRSGPGTSLVADAFVDTSPAGSPLTADVADQRFMHAAQAATRVDAFDPHEFNRRFHGRSQSRRTATLNQSPLEDVR